LTEVGGGGGGGGGNRGRPFTRLSQYDKESIALYLYAKDDLEQRRTYTEDEKQQYKRGRLLLSQNKKNNPEVVAYRKEMEDYLGVGKPGKKA
jgi:hypothetical protein